MAGLEVKGDAAIGCYKLRIFPCGQAHPTATVVRLLTRTQLSSQHQQFGAIDRLGKYRLSSSQPQQAHLLLFGGKQGANLMATCARRHDLGSFVSIRTQRLSCGGICHSLTKMTAPSSLNGW